MSNWHVYFVLVHAATNWVSLALMLSVLNVFWQYLYGKLLLKKFKKGLNSKHGLFSNLQVVADKNRLIRQIIRHQITPNQTQQTETTES